MIDLAGLWVSIGVLCSAVASLIIFAMYKQYFGVVELPERVLETKTLPAAKGTPATEDLPPPYPEGTAHAYQQTVEDESGVTVEIHPGPGEACSPIPDHVYEQPIELETST